MNKEYINKNEIYRLIKHEAETHELPESKNAYERAARIVDQMHPVNIAIMEQKTGRWIPIRQLLTAVKCSECKRACADRTNYCPCYGAKMESN